MFIGGKARKLMSLMLVFLVIFALNSQVFAAKGGGKPDPVPTAPVITSEKLTYTLLAGETINDQVLAAFKPADRLIWTVEPTNGYLKLGSVSYDRRKTQATQQFSITPAVGDVSTTFTVTASDSLNPDLFDRILIEVNIVDELVYLALGDSIPYGTFYSSLWDYLSGGTDTNSYVEQFASFIGADVFLDESISGDNAIDVYSDVMGHLSDEVQTADVITLSIGANDIMDAAARNSSGLDKYNIDWIIADQGLASFTTYWSQIINRIYELNPDVQLIVMTVYNPYRTSETIYNSVNAYFEGGVAPTHTIGDGLNDIIRADSRYKVADIYQAFNATDIRDSFTGFYNSFCDPHPNQVGQDFIFDNHATVYGW